LESIDKMVDYNYIPEDFTRKCILEYRIPEYMIGGLYRYIVHHIEPGSFLRAVISNDLFDALGRADSTNSNLLKNYAQFLYNEAPSSCWGSRETYDGWIKNE